MLAKMIPIDVFREQCQTTLPGDACVWYTETLRSHHLVPLEEFFRSHIPGNATFVDKYDVPLKIMPTSFKHPQFFMLHTSAEAVLIFALDFEIPITKFVGIDKASGKDESVIAEGCVENGVFTVTKIHRKKESK